MTESKPEPNFFEEEEEEKDEKQQWDNNNGDEATTIEKYLDIHSIIGRDCTLDYEEEKDQHDQVAVRTKQIGDRLYMKDVNFVDYGIRENEYVQLPNTFRTAMKDSRANHHATKIGQKEYAEPTIV